MIIVPGSSAGDIEGVTAGDGLSGGGTSGTVSVALDLNELTAAAVADGDFIPIIDTNDSNGSRKEAVHDLATLFAGTGLTATSSVVAVDASQAITALTGGDLTIYEDANNADVSLKLGTSATESLSIEVLNGSGNKTAEEIHFSTATASATANHGKMVFDIDGTDILTIDDGGIDIASGKTVAINGTDIVSSPITALNNATAGEIPIIGSTTTELDAQANLTFASNVLTVGADADIEPQIILLNDENSLQIGVANGTNDMIAGSADGDAVINSVGDHKILIAQNDTLAVTIDADGDVTFANNIDGGVWGGTTISVGAGGTGATTLTDGGILLGSGTSAVTAMAVLSDGEMIVGDGTTDPVAESGATLRTSIGVGTGDSPQFTGIELGHASDTTLARSASGTVTIEGNIITTVGTQDMWIPASAMRPASSNGCAKITDVESTSGRPDMQVLDFDKDSDEFAQFSVAFPQSYNAGTVTFQAYWTSAGTNTGTVAWGMAGVSCGDNDTIDVAYGTAVVATAKAHSGTAEDLNVSAESGAITIANAAKGELVFFAIHRDVSADDNTGDARLVGVKLSYTTDAATD